MIPRELLQQMQQRCGGCWDASCGHPACSACTPCSAGGLPITVQHMGPRGMDLCTGSLSLEAACLQCSDVWGGLGSQVAADCQQREREILRQWAVGCQGEPDLHDRLRRHV